MQFKWAKHILRYFQNIWPFLVKSIQTLMQACLLAIGTKTQGQQNSIFPKLKQNFPKTQAQFSPKLKFSENHSSIMNHEYFELEYFQPFSQIGWLFVSFCIDLQRKCVQIITKSSKTQEFSWQKLKQRAKTQFFGNSIHQCCRPICQRTSLV